MHERLERTAAVAIPRQRSEHGDADVLGNVVGQVLPAWVAEQPGAGVAVGDQPDTLEQRLDVGLAPALCSACESGEVTDGRRRVRMRLQRLCPRGCHEDKTDMSLQDSTS